ncbi:uncharacterized protein BCR38DRAFT_490447 [Pseudomassariella vexata]|uniref:Uncharacterized protein n=1 Tax=Pseudomassariella vexata TaxID=1141098 RepID=A0A1Y2DD17_9PEZI|nr:uncharacterized protein BCR38DRAFT_490447 [Pseudomassariella vexata]ORY57004.1 hypothetical protein BCR38DRAFT_490447 [Pseudomassariella vexata]
MSLGSNLFLNCSVVQPDRQPVSGLQVSLCCTHSVTSTFCSVTDSFGEIWLWTLLVAAAFLSDMHFSELGVFNIDCIFTDQYEPLLHELGSQVPCWAEFAAAVRREVHLMTAVVIQQGRPRADVLLATLKEAGSGLTSLPTALLARIAQQELCLCCLTHQPSRRLTCGHQVRDHCIRRYDLSSCLLCGVGNTALLQVKPLNGGVRALSLAGDVAGARTLACLLQSLRSELRSPLCRHFDLVRATGVGIFFGLMIFCKQASVEECLHHLPRIRQVKVKHREFKFGRRLKFRREELHSDLVTVTTWVASHW